MSTLHQDSIIIDGLNISKFEKPVFEDMRKGGITAANCTVSVGKLHQDRRQHRRDEEEDPRQQRAADAGAHDGRHLPREEGRQDRRDPGFQNAHAFEDNIGYIEAFADMGVRVVQLCYNTRTSAPVATSVTAACRTSVAK